MADVITDNLELTLPEVGASAATWGGKWNDNGEKLDAFAGNVIGRGTLLNSANNLNAVLTPGRYYWTTASIPSNTPPTSPGGLLLLDVVPVDAGTVRQDVVFLSVFGAPEHWSRFVGTAVLGASAWRMTYSQANIVGLVSAGSAFEIGSNANGHYTKFADGTMICRHTFTESVAINIAHFGGYRSPEQTWSFPQTFSAAPQVFVDAAGNSAFGATGLTLPTNFSGRFAWTSITTQGVAPRTAMVQAVGRWA